MNAEAKRLGMVQAKVHPRYLHTNSTSHTWPFSAVAELIDNAYDPDVSASDLWIGYTKINGKPCLTFTDNGAGMDMDHLQMMLSFGYCEKEKYEKEIARHSPIGQYGNGFKSGSMRLANDALVFTVHKDTGTACIGFLSQSLCAERKLDRVVLPLMEFFLPNFERSDNEDLNMEDSLEAILDVSPYSHEEELLNELQELYKQKNRTGTKIVLFGLKRNSNGMSELDFESCKNDIRNPETHDKSQGASPQDSRVWEYKQSLRTYCSILYQKPRMKIFIHGIKVDHFLIKESLRRSTCFVYKPRGNEKGAEIIFGRAKATSKLEDFGVMFYHRNRLIDPYVKIGRMEDQDWGVAERVVGLVDATHILDPIHNKQEFQDNTIEYKSAIKAIKSKLAAYLDHKPADENEEDERDQWTWVQCDNCNKWRRMPAFASTPKRNGEWFCYLNPDQSMNRCDFGEEVNPDEYDVPGSFQGGRTPKGGRGTGKGSRQRHPSQPQTCDDAQDTTQSAKRRSEEEQEVPETKRARGSSEEEGMHAEAGSGGSGLDANPQAPSCSLADPDSPEDDAAQLLLQPAERISPQPDLAGAEPPQPPQPAVERSGGFEFNPEWLGPENGQPSAELSSAASLETDYEAEAGRLAAAAVLLSSPELERGRTTRSRPRRGRATSGVRRGRSHGRSRPPPGAANTESPMSTVEHRSNVVLYGPEGQRPDQPLNQPPCCCAELRRNLRRLLLHLRESDGVDLGEVGSEDTDEDLLRRTMEYFKLPTE